MGETRIVATFVLRDRGMLMVTLPADSTAADVIRFGDAVELCIGPDVTVAMRHAAVELARPVTGPPCVVLLGLRPHTIGAAGHVDLDEIDRLIARHPGVDILLRWSSAAE